MSKMQIPSTKEELNLYFFLTKIHYVL